MGFVRWVVLVSVSCGRVLTVGISAQGAAQQDWYPSELRGSRLWGRRFGRQPAAIRSMGTSIRGRSRWM